MGRVMGEEMEVVKVEASKERVEKWSLRLKTPPGRLN